MERHPVHFESIPPEEIRRSPFTLIADDWFLLTAGSPEKGFNTMTAAWGALGELWSRKTAFVFVRPQRHTMRFMESSGLFTMSFLPGDYREALQFCGTHSGRDVDKPARTGLTPFAPAEGATAFEEAGLILVCRKIHAQDLDPERFLDPSIGELYPAGDYHRLYVGEILEVLRKPGKGFQGSGEAAPGRAF